MRNWRLILIWLLVYIVGLSSTIGSLCVLDFVPCLATGDTREWTLQLIAVVVALLAGKQNEK